MWYSLIIKREIYFCLIKFVFPIKVIFFYGSHFFVLNAYFNSISTVEVQEQINVQALSKQSKIKVLQWGNWEFFIKINKRAYTSIPYTRVYEIKVDSFEEGHIFKFTLPLFGNCRLKVVLCQIYKLMEVEL